MAYPNIVRLIYRNIAVNTDPGTLVILVGLPSMYLVFFGFGFGSLIPSGVGPRGYLAFITPGIMSFQVVMAGSVGGGILWADRRWGMLAQLLVGPFTRLQYLLGIMFTSVLFGLAGALVMLVAAGVLSGALSLTSVGLFVMFGTIVLGSVFFGSLMLFISAMVKSNNAYNSIQILIIFVVNFASTVFYPLSPTLPVAIQALFEVNPLTYVTNAVRDGYYGTYQVDHAYQVLTLCIETMIVLFLAVRAYMRSDVSYE